MVLINISEAIERREIAMDGIPMWAQGGVLGLPGRRPEAFDVARDFAGLITVAGFLAAFALSKLGG